MSRRQWKLGGRQEIPGRENREQERRVALSVMIGYVSKKGYSWQTSKEGQGQSKYNFICSYKEFCINPEGSTEAH